MNWDLRIRVRRSLVIAGITTATFTHACDVVDESEIGQEAGEVALGFCGAVEAPLLLSSEGTFQANPASLPNLYDDFGSCGLADPLVGAEGFFSIQVFAGERYTVNANPLNDDTDLSLYALPTCDFRTCDVATNNCGAGAAEQLTVIAREDGIRFIGVDAVNPGPVNFTVRRTVCGNDEFEIGEACDDGEANGLDADCSPECRLIVRDGGNEREPNDAKNAENEVILASEGQTVVGGRLTGSCDVDRFRFEVTEGTSVSVKLFAIGANCTDDALASLEFTDLRDPVRNSAGTRPVGAEEEACLELSGVSQMQNLPAGSYQVVVRTPRGTAGQLFTYRLQLDTN
ncbi:MAG: hypothetical protein AAF715_19430 [Myxococcota bacterium]